MSRRSGILEFAVLGLLRESPMHGYELRKRLNTSLGVFRAFSYGTLYPCLKTLVANGWLIEESGGARDEAGAVRPHEVGERGEHRPVQWVALEFVREELRVADGDGVVCRPGGLQEVRLGHGRFDHADAA